MKKAETPCGQNIWIFHDISSFFVLYMQSYIEVFQIFHTFRHYWPNYRNYFLIQPPSVTGKESLLNAMHCCSTAFTRMSIQIRIFHKKIRMTSNKRNLMINQAWYKINIVSKLTRKQQWHSERYHANAKLSYIFCSHSRSSFCFFCVAPLSFAVLLWHLLEQLQNWRTDNDKK